MSAPQWVWEPAHGPIPEGRWLKAVVQRCVLNPDHLEPVVPVGMVGGHERAKTQCPGGTPQPKSTYVAPTGNRVRRTRRRL